jgi:hypothetical protein
VKTILIVDEDLGFVFWLGRISDTAGYEAFPAKTVGDAGNLLSWLSIRLDLLVINPSSPGADSFIAALRSSPGLNIVGIFEGESHEEISGIDAWYRKPDRVDELSQLEWLSVVESLLGNGESSDTKAAGR